MKTSWRRLLSSSSEDAFKTSSRRPDQGEYIRLTHASSENVFKTSSRRLDQDQYIRPGHTSSRRLQDVFKTSSRCLQDVLQKRLQDIETSSRRLAKMFSRGIQKIFKASCKNVFKTSPRHLQDVFKTYYQASCSVNTFSRFFRDVVKTFLTRTSKRVIYRRICVDHTYSQCTKFARVTKVSQILIFHFTTPSSSCLQRRI